MSLSFLKLLVVLSLRANIVVNMMFAVVVLSVSSGAIMCCVVVRQNISA